MLRMSQKLLTILIIILFPVICVSTEWKLIGSIETGPLGIRLKNPLSVYISKDLKVYVTDTGNNRFLSFSNNLRPLKQFNAGGTVITPIGMIKDPEGNLWYIERRNNSIVKINLKTRNIEKKKLNIFPDRITIYKDKIVVIDRFSGNIVLINKEFEISKILSLEENNFKGFFDVKVKKDKIYGMENLTGRIICFNMKNMKVSSIMLSKKMVQPISFDLDSNGNIYILDRYLKKVFIFNQSGRLLCTMLKEGEKEGELYYPWQIIIFKKIIFIVDEGNGRVDVYKF